MGNFADLKEGDMEGLVPVGFGLVVGTMGVLLLVRGFHVRPNSDKILEQEELGDWERLMLYVEVEKRKDLLRIGGALVLAIGLLIIILGYTW
jgi:hypothetical protein